VRRPLALVGAAALVIAIAMALGGRGGADASLEDRVQNIASGLRCPVCQNLSVADSPSQLAGEMRSEIASRLRAGASEDEIRAYFVERYGDWVLLEPPKSGFNLIPWLVPVVAFVVGVGVWFVLVRRRPSAADDEATVPA
jgi:cytochrome c-type biogenesis protein CcmH